MGENKICSSCGNTIPAEAVFCPNCGGVQAASDGQAQGSEGPAASIEERIAQETGSTNEKARPVTVQAPVQQPVSPRPAAQQGYPQTQPPYQQAQQPYNSISNPAQQKSKFNKKVIIGLILAVVGIILIFLALSRYNNSDGELYSWISPFETYEIITIVMGAIGILSILIGFIIAPKLVFPFFWITMLVFILIWIYCFLDPSYEQPEITVDTIRILTLAISIVLLIYTITIRLITKKLKFIPTILLIIFFLLSLFMYSSFELIPGDKVHDVLSPITNSIFQIE